MQSRKPRKVISTTVSLDSELYQKALTERIAVRDTTFSRYVRELIREDLHRSGLLAPGQFSVAQEAGS